MEENPRVELLLDEIEDLSKISFSRSSGPGGQNVNKRDTKVTLSCAIDKITSLKEEEISRLRIAAEARGWLTQGDLLSISDQSTRSQKLNQGNIWSKIEEIVQEALTPPKPRKKTKPTKASKERRLLDKRHQGQKKKLRSGHDD